MKHILAENMRRFGTKNLREDMMTDKDLATQFASLKKTILLVQLREPSVTDVWTNNWTLTLYTSPKGNIPWQLIDYTLKQQTAEKYQLISAAGLDFIYTADNAKIANPEIVPDTIWCAVKGGGADTINSIDQLNIYDTTQETRLPASEKSKVTGFIIRPSRFKTQTISKPSF